MEFMRGIGDMAIADVIAKHPEVGEILARHDIACITCKVGICLLKDVVSIHGLSVEDESRIEQEINLYLNGKGD